MGRVSNSFDGGSQMGPKATNVVREPIIFQVVNMSKKLDANRNKVVKFVERKKKLTLATGILPTTVAKKSRQYGRKY